MNTAEKAPSPLVSVVIPTCRGSEYILRAVDSILKQTYTPIETIVVDDNGKGSEEQRRTEQLLAPLIREGKIRYVVHEVHRNGSAARNTGARCSAGVFLAFLDDDDESTPDRIQMLTERMTEADHSCALVYHSRMVYDATITPEKLKRTEIARKNGRIARSLLLNRATINTNTFLIRKQCFDLLGGFDESFRRHQDYEFSVRVAARWKVLSIPAVGAISHKYYRNEPNLFSERIGNMRHYIEKMLPYIDSYCPLTRTLIISTRFYLFFPASRKDAVKAARPYFRFLYENYRACRETVREWLPHYNLLTYLFSAVYVRLFVRR